MLPPVNFAPGEKRGCRVARYHFDAILAALKLAKDTLPKAREWLKQDRKRQKSINNQSKSWDLPGRC